MYECDQTCYNFTNKHLCKHIHRVHSIRLLSQPDKNQDSDEQMSLGNADMDDDNPFEYAEHLRNPITGNNAGQLQ